MIITRTPFRVSFCGGGSDLPAFYKQHEGCVLSTSIRKYIYLSLHDYFEKDKIILKYSKTELVDNFDQIEHKYFKQCLQDFNIKGIAISSMADIPAGTGLGSSSSFIVGLLQLLHSYKGQYISKYDLAQKACEIEINKLNQPIGKQDQFAASFGGLNFYEFLPNEEVSIKPVIMKTENYKQLENNLLLFYIGGSHSASEILKDQAANLKNKINNQIKMCDLAKTLYLELSNNNIDAMGALLHENWMLKKELSSGISNTHIDDIYNIALSTGATGGKLLGAGGAGFMLFYVPGDKQKIRTALSAIREVDFKIDTSGSSIIFCDKDCLR